MMLPVIELVYEGLWLGSKNDDGVLFPFTIFRSLKDGGALLMIFRGNTWEDGKDTTFFCYILDWKSGFFLLKQSVFLAL